MRQQALILLPVLVVLLAASQSASSAASKPATAQSIEIALDALQQTAETDPAFPLNTVPEGCVEKPLPLTPIGPTVETVIENFQTSARLIAWRAPCSTRDSALMVTFEPIEGEMFVCSSRVEITQDGVQFDTARLVKDPENGRRFCGDLTTAVTTVVDQPQFTETFDHNGGFNLMYQGTVNHFIWVPPYDPTLYFSPEEFELRAIGPTLGGLWYEPQRPGQGLLLQLAVEEGDLRLVVFWFTYVEGRQRFLFGSQAISAAQRTVTVDLSETRGAQFGSAFRPADVIIQPWGSIDFEFDSCNQAHAAYRSQDGAQHGSLALQRLTHLAGLQCREQDD